MMNNLRKLFLLILCVGLIGGAAMNVSAQGGGVLATAGGKSLRQADVDKLIGFFEWAFEKKFTSEQRREYQAIKAESFQKDPAGEKKGIDDMANVFAAVQTKDENEQARLREAFTRDFVGKLRNADDPEARLLLSVYEGTQATAGAEEETTGGGDLSAIVGKWVWARTGSSGMNGSGVYIGSNGSRFTYQFFSNGAVEFTGIMNVMQGSCNQQIFRSIKGQASLSGNALTIHWGPEKFTRDFSCDRANNYTKTIPAKTETLRIGFKNDLGQRQLCIVDGDCFSPTK